jgi:hypothetical protein
MTVPDLEPPDKLRRKEVISTNLYYARAIDSTMLVALSSLAFARTSQATAIALTQLLNNAATHPDAQLTYHTSDMVLHVHSDTSDQSETKVRSCAGGFICMSSSDPPFVTTIDSNAAPPPLNGRMHVPRTILNVVVSSAAKAVFGALFYNGKKAAWLTTTLNNMGHPQPPTPIQTGNSCAAGISSNTVNQRRSKAIDMRFYWIKDCVAQNMFAVHWRQGSDNLANYFTKHHPLAHAKPYLLDLHQPTSLSHGGEGVLIHNNIQTSPGTVLATDTRSSNQTKDQPKLAQI